MHFLYKHLFFWKETAPFIGVFVGLFINPILRKFNRVIVAVVDNDTHLIKRWENRSYPENCAIYKDGKLLKGIFR